MWNGKNIPFGKGIKISEPFDAVRALIGNENTLVAKSTLGVVYVATRFNILVHCCIYFATGECVNFLTGMLAAFQVVEHSIWAEGMSDSANLLFVVNVIPTFIMRSYCSGLCWSCNVTPQTKPTTSFLRVGSMTSLLQNDKMMQTRVDGSYMHKYSSVLL